MQPIFSRGRSPSAPLKAWRRAVPAFTAAALLTLAACQQAPLRQARSLVESGRHEEALMRLREAAEARPDDIEIRKAYFKQRDAAIVHLIAKLEAARAAGRLDEVNALLARIEQAAPGHPRAAWLREDLARTERHQRLLAEAREALGQKKWAQAEAALRAIVAETPGHAEARTLLATLDERRAEQTRQQSSLQLATATKPITLEFREAALRSVFETLARAANVNFVFDKDVRGDAKVTLFLRNTTVDEALRVILNTQQLGSKLLNGNTVLVFPNNAQKQRELLDTVTRSFYLVNADPKMAQTLVRTMAKSRDVFIDERLNLLVVRDTPEVVRLVERLIASIDLPDPEVMLEVEVLEVSSKNMERLGILWPESINYGIPGGTGPITGTSGLRASVANPVAIASLRGTADATNLLANPRIRARNREKAKVLLGEKVPVFTTTATANVGVSASVSYLDVGLKVEIEPQVQLDNEVVIKVALEVSSITGTVTGPQESKAYQVGTRQASTSLRLRDGETQVLAGLINDKETQSSAGLPYLHRMPVLGRLFGRTEDGGDKTEVVLLITPRIVRNLGTDMLPTQPMASGTEVQPGAPAWTMQGDAGNIAGRGRQAALGQAGTSRGEASEVLLRPQLAGPEEVPPGGSFQINVVNPTGDTVRGSILFDGGVLSTQSVPPGQGSLAVEVPPRGSASATFTVKPDAAQGEVAFNLDAGGATWTVRIRDPRTAPPEPATPPADEDVRR